MVEVVNQFPNEVAADGSKPNHQERGCAKISSNGSIMQLVHNGIMHYTVVPYQSVVYILTSIRS